MNVRELIAELQKHPPEMEVCIADVETGEYETVVEVLHEWGHTSIDLLTTPSGSVPVPPEEIGDG